MGTRAASISLFAVKYLRYMFHVVCKLAPFASVSHWAISCIHVMSVSVARPAMVLSISLNMVAIRSSVFFGGWPAFFGMSGGVGVEGWEAPTALSGAEDVDDDDNCAEVRGMG